LKLATACQWGRGAQINYTVSYTVVTIKYSPTIMEQFNVSETYTTKKS
jgi:hypothetical protein